jgi:predicted amidohydrolase
MNARRFVAAAAQMCATEDLNANLAICEALAADAAGRGAKLLVLPECFAFLGRREGDKNAVAESLDAQPPGPIVATLARIARAHQMWVIGGGMPERAAADDRSFNTAVAVSPTGSIAARYRKIHLFDVDIPGRAVLRESDRTAAGAAPVAVDTPLARIGLSICYDLRFPELYRGLVRDGAQVLVVPAAFTAHTGAAHWHTLLRARAIENQCFVIAAAQYGQHNEKRASYGHSLIFDPWGELLDERAEGDGVVTAEIDLDTMDGVRQRMPCLSHAALLPRE